MKKKYASKFMFVVLAILLLSIYYGVEIVGKSTNNLDLNVPLPLCDLSDELRDGEYASFDMRDWKTLERITIFPYYSPAIPLEEQEGIVVLSNESEYKNILNSFQNLEVASGWFDLTGDFPDVRMVIETDKDNFYDVIIKDNFIHVWSNRIWSNSKTYAPDCDYAEFIRNEIKNMKGD